MGVSVVARRAYGRATNLRRASAAARSSSPRVRGDTLPTCPNSPEEYIIFLHLRKIRFFAHVASPDEYMAASGEYTFTRDANWAISSLKRPLAAGDPRVARRALRGGRQT